MFFSVKLNHNQLIFLSDKKKTHSNCSAKFMENIQINDLKIEDVVPLKLIIIHTAACFLSQRTSFFGMILLKGAHFKNLFGT